MTNEEIITLQQGLPVKNEDFFGSSIKIRSHNGQGKTIVKDCNFYYCDFNNIRVEDFEFINCDFKECTFNPFVYYNCKFTNVDFLRCSFCDVIGYEFNDSNFFDCDIIDTSFYNSKNGKFNTCKIKNCDFCNTENFNFETCEVLKEDLSQSDFPTQKQILDKFFNYDKEGNLIGYKIFNFKYCPPESWKIEEGEFITEVVDHNRFVECSYGINVATKEWIRQWLLSGETATIWKVKIMKEDFLEICAPYESDGKIRAGRVKLIEEFELTRIF